MKPSSHVRAKNKQHESPKNKINKTLVRKPEDTSWGGVASWYDGHLEKSGDTYHEKVVFPNLLRIIGKADSKRVLDLACGQGQFSRMLAEQGVQVTGVDLGKELIALAEKRSKELPIEIRKNLQYFNGSADDLYMLKDASYDMVVCVLALQNIEQLQKTIKEVSRILVPSGRFIFVLNHPAFRNPKKTKWGFDEHENTQYRRVDEYMSESHVKIDMTPGSQTNKKYTVSFHRPLQVYMKMLFKSGFVVNHFEEWVSHKVSEQGPKKKAEDLSRKEIPLFLCMEAKKI